MTSPHVVVIGGGLAGLSAGLGCADAGARVTVLEARPRLGGATWSFQRNGRWFDNGQHVFLRCCTSYLSFLDRIGATGSIRLQDRLSVPVLRPAGADGQGRTAWVRRTPGLPAPLHLGPALAGYGHLGWADRARLGRAALALCRLDLADPALDRVTFGEWLGRRGQRPAAVAALWDLIALPTVNLPAAQASLAMAAKVFQTGLLTDASAGDIGWAMVPLAHLHADPAALALSRAGATVRVRARVDALERTPQPRAGAEQPEDLAWSVLVDGERLDADAVVLAVPHQAAAQILPAGAIPRPDRLEGLGTSPIVNVGVVYDRRVMDLEMAAGLGTPVQWVFDRSRAAGLGDGPEQALGISLSAADEWLGRRPEELVDTFVAALAELFPAARAARVQDAVVTRERAATFRARPGTAALRPPARTALPGLALAGAWTDTGWPATMEGAVRSGQAAAHQVLSELRTDRPPAPDRPPTGKRTPAADAGRGHDHIRPGTGRSLHDDQTLHDDQDEREVVAMTGPATPSTRAPRRQPHQRQGAGR